MGVYDCVILKPINCLLWIICYANEQLFISFLFYFLGILVRFDRKEQKKKKKKQQ